MRTHLAAAFLSATLLAGCGDDPDDTTTDPTRGQSTETTTSQHVDQVEMPDLLGLPRSAAMTALGELEISVAVGPSRPSGCGTRPRTVAVQNPPAGTLIGPEAEVTIRETSMDLKSSRGPCDIYITAVGDLSDANKTIAEQFYRFAADPSLGAPFAAEGVRVSVGAASKALTPTALDDLKSWSVHTVYAESEGAFSPLNVVAGSGGYFEVRQGTDRCVGQEPATAGTSELRPLTLSAPTDVVTSCMEWWAVTLFLDEENRIAHVSLALGSP